MSFHHLSARRFGEVGELGLTQAILKERIQFVTDCRVGVFAMLGAELWVFALNVSLPSVNDPADVAGTNSPLSEHLFGKSSNLGIAFVCEHGEIGLGLVCHRTSMATHHPSAQPRRADR